MGDEVRRSISNSSKLFTIFRDFPKILLHWDTYIYIFVCFRFEVDSWIVEKTRKGIERSLSSYYTNRIRTDKLEFHRWSNGGKRRRRGIGRCANPLRYSRYFSVIAFAVLHSYLRNPFSTYTRILSIIITSLAREIVEMLCQTRLIVVRRSHLVHTSLAPFFFFSFDGRIDFFAGKYSLSITTIFSRERGRESRGKRNKKLMLG